MQQREHAPHDGGARVLELNDGLLYARALQLVAELRIADLLAGGPRGVEDLARVTGGHPDALYRLLRVVASQGILREVPEGAFALTPTGETLREDHPESVLPMVLFSNVVCRVFDDAMHSVRTGAATFPETFGRPFFEHLRHDAEAGALFNSAMASVTRMESGAVVDACDFRGSPRVVDIGGGDGTLLSAILRANPGARGVVFDQPHVAEAAAKRMEERGLADRCTTVGGDLFGEIPPGGDVYLLKWILHDWEDAEAVSILQGCRRAMSPGSRLLLIERMVPVDDAPHPAKALDMVMLVLLGGRERTRDAYARLLTKSGFSVTRDIATGTPLGVLEARPAGETL